ncbi:MAG: MFS transporter [Spirochaetaceae bacterium]|jgi:MFS family permease|nr:MFS transporter [Spirochaetaceae bacterium]
MKNIFSIPDFRRLYAARFISTVGAKFFMLAIAWWILHSNFKNANGLLGLIMAATAIGTFGFSPFMGAVADRFSKKTTMIIALLGSSAALVVTIVLFALGVFDRFPLSFVLVAVLVYAFEPLAETSMQGSLNRIVDSELLPNAVSSVSGITSFSQAIGAVCAGAAIMATGVLGAFAFDAFCYIISIFFIWRIKTALPAPDNQQASESQIGSPKKNSYWKDFAEGFSYVYHERELFFLLIFFAFLNFWASPIVLALPIIATTVFKGNAMLMSFYEIALGGGVIAITTLIGFVKRPFNRYAGSFFSLLLCGISLGAFSFCGAEGLLFGKALSFVFVFIFGIGLGLINVSMMTLFQVFVPVYIQGRFFSILNTIAGAVIPLSYAMVGFASSKFGIMNLMFINGCVLCASSFIMLCIPKIKIDYVI